MKYESTIWQRYEIDPLDLIGRAARITVVLDKGRVSTATGRRGRRGEGHIYFGVIESIREHRGKVTLDEPDQMGDWADEMLSADFDDNYPFVLIELRGGETVRFNPEKDAVSIEWVLA